jgi:hypothetical protein
MWRAGGLALAVLVLFCAPASAEGVNGRWVGWYICAQGLTVLTLTITGDDQSDADHHVEALFSFHALPDNPSVPSGAFTMHGFHMRDDRLVLNPGEWVERPGIYETVHLLGRVESDVEGDVLRGNVFFRAAPSLCTVFELRREPGIIS